MNTIGINLFIVGALLSIQSTSFAFGQRFPLFEGFHTSTPVAPSVPTSPSGPSSSTSTSYTATWEKKDSSRAVWSNTIRQVVDEKAPFLFKGPGDVEQFCPMYSRLGTQDKLNFWVEFFSAVALYESNDKPTARMVETTMSIDPITGKQVESEGLLQLSYQDVQWAPYCEFNYQADKKYAVTDVRRSILDPATNLSCGIQILNDQVKKYGNIALSSNVYWATLKIGGKYTKLTEIKRITNALSFCK